MTMVETGRDGGVGIVRFARPPANHISVDLARAIADAFAAADADPAVRAILLCAEGRIFSGGADLHADESAGGDRSFTNALYAEAARLFATATPIVAAVGGAAVGAGLGLALAADFRVASPAARFVANFVKLGFHPGFGLSLTLPRAIGAQRAAEMLLTGRRVGGEEAHRWGLADRLASADTLDAEALAFAHTIAENAPLALEATRATLRAGLVDAFRAATAHEAAEQARLRTTADFAEGIRAVAERRPGRFERR